MESQPDQSPLIVIVGETGSGKSALALELAQQFNGEIIAADSRTIYTGMDIGTAKPTTAERQLVPHHLIDIASPEMTFTAADFKRQAQASIVAIAARKNVPFLVGGTGLYVDAVLYDFSFAQKADSKERLRLQSLDVAALQAELQAQGISLPANERNPRHLIRQLETGGMPTQDKQLRSDTLILGTQLQPDELAERIHIRVGKMREAGLEQEVSLLVEKYGWDCAVLQTIGYREWQPYFAGQTTISQVFELIEKNTLQYAKRQRTWFKRNKSIHWIAKKEEAVDLITTFLNK